MSENRCFAFNQSKQRCDLEGGHSSDHSITMSWMDEDCYDPSVEVTLTAPTIVYGTGPVTAVGGGGAYQNGPPPMPGDSDECLICDHRLHRGMCAVADCDCRNGMPK